MPRANVNRIKGGGYTEVGLWQGTAMPLPVWTLVLTAGREAAERRELLGEYAGPRLSMPPRPPWPPSPPRLSSAPMAADNGEVWSQDQLDYWQREQVRRSASSAAGGRDAAPWLARRRSPALLAQM